MTPSHRLLSEIYEQSVAPVMEDTRKGIEQLAAFTAGQMAIEQKFKEYEAAITIFNNSVRALERLSYDPLLLKLAKTLYNKENNGDEMSSAEDHKYEIFHTITEENLRALINELASDGIALSPMDTIYRSNDANG